MIMMVVKMIRTMLNAGEVFDDVHTLIFQQSETKSRNSDISKKLKQEPEREVTYHHCQVRAAALYGSIDVNKIWLL